MIQYSLKEARDLNLKGKELMEYIEDIVEQSIVNKDKIKVNVWDIAKGLGKDKKSLSASYSRWKKNKKPSVLNIPKAKGPKKTKVTRKKDFSSFVRWAELKYRDDPFNPLLNYWIRRVNQKDKKIIYETFELAKEFIA